MKAHLCQHNLSIIIKGSLVSPQSTTSAITLGHFLTPGISANDTVFCFCAELLNELYYLVICSICTGLYCYEIWPIFQVNSYVQKLETLTLQYTFLAVKLFLLFISPAIIISRRYRISMNPNDVSNQRINQSFPLLQDFLVISH